MNKVYKKIAIGAFIIGITTGSVVTIYSHNEVEEVNPFSCMMNYDLTIKEIVREGDMFKWTLDDNVDSEKVKGYTYTIKVDNVAIISSFANTTEIKYIPKHNGEYSFLVRAIETNQSVGETKELKFTVKEDGLEEINIEENLVFGELYEDTEFNKLFYKITNTTDDVSLYHLLQLYTEMKEVPLFILEDMYNRGYKIYLTGYDLERIHEVEPENNLAGLFKPSEKAIFISTWNYYTRRATIHEIGHYIDYVLGDEECYASTNDKEFINIYNEEKEFTLEVHHRSSVKEHFAYAYSKFIKSPTDLKNKQPQTYEYMSRIHERYEKLLEP